MAGRVEIQMSLLLVILIDNREATLNEIVKGGQQGCHFEKKQGTPDGCHFRELPQLFVTHNLHECQAVRNTV